jgi:hypothetical protein
MSFVWTGTVYQQHNIYFVRSIDADTFYDLYVMYEVLMPRMYYFISVITSLKVANTRRNL